MKKYKILSLLVNLILLNNILLVDINNILLRLFLYIIIFRNILKDISNKKSKYIERLILENRNFLIFLGYMIYFLIMLYFINLF